MSKFTWFISFVFVLSAPTAATTLTWPGATPCNGTLATCIQLSANSDTIQLATNGPIDEDVVTSTAISLIAAPGFRPVFKAGRSIAVTPSPGSSYTGTVRIDGITVLDGAVNVTIGSGTFTVKLQHLDVTMMTAPAVQAYGGIFAGSFVGLSVAEQTYDLSFNRVTLGIGNFICGIRIYGETTTASIHDNRVVSTNQQTPYPDCGIVVSANRNTASAGNLLVYSNQVSGHLISGMTLDNSNDFNLNVLNNAIACSGPLDPINEGINDGMSIFNSGGNLTLQIFNNTIAGCYGAVDIFGTSTGTLSGRVTNNIFADAVDGFSNRFSGSTITNDYNLLFNFGTNTNFSAGTGTIASDPLFVRGDFDVRLGAGSPAINAGDGASLRTLLTNLGISQIDADGLRRFKDTEVDIGAFKYGDRSLSVITTAANAGRIDDTDLNNDPLAAPILSQTNDIDSYVSAQTDTGSTGLKYDSAYSVYDEADASAPTTGSNFVVFAPEAGSDSFIHQVSSSNVSGLYTYLDDSTFRATPSQVLLATHRSPAYNHLFGVEYVFGGWYIEQLDGSGTLPTGLAFDVYAQDPSLDAFVWKTPLAGLSQSALDNVLLNGNACARVFVGNGTLDPHPIAAKYIGGRWNIVNLDNAPIPLNAPFYVVIDEAATSQCQYDHVFHDGFDGS